MSEAVSAQRRANDDNASGQNSAKDEKAQMRKFSLECYCAGGKGRRAKEVHGGKVVLRDGKVCLFFFGVFGFFGGVLGGLFLFFELFCIWKEEE